MLDFRPPKDNPFIIGLAKLLLPWIHSGRMGGAEVVVVGDGIARFKKLAGKHMMICPNHSHRHDPEVMFTLACKAGENFNFIAAREVFDWNHGFNGWSLQQMGVYSVVRGAVDRESFKTTKRLLVEGKKKLVLFPEGEISRQNDVLLPLETGAAQLSFMALDELAKNKPDEPLYILPVAIKYTYKDNLTEQLAELLTRAEQRLGLDNSKEPSLYKRVRQAAEVVLKTLEEEYNRKPAADADLNSRITDLKTHILKVMAEFLDVKLKEDGSHLDWVRVLRNTMDDYIYADEESLPPYQKKIHEEREVKIKAFYKDLDRVVNFIAIYDGYLSPPATQERMINVLELIESEVFGLPKIKGRRKVFISIGEPINLMELHGEYKKAKKKVIEQVCGQISGQIDGMLKELEKSREAVIVS